MKPKILLLFYFRSQGFRKSLQYIVKLTIKIIRCDDLCSTKDPKKLLLRIKVWKTFFVQYFKLFNIVTNCDKFSVVWQFWWSHKKMLISIVREIVFFFIFFFLLKCSLDPTGYHQQCKGKLKRKVLIWRIIMRKRSDSHFFLWIPFQSSYNSRIAKTSQKKHRRSWFKQKVLKTATMKTLFKLLIKILIMICEFVFTLLPVVKHIKFISYRRDNNGPKYKGLSCEDNPG